ncbi:FecR family protein [Chitinophaga parva]|uniref:FecR family protein n=1 Tax=Chitinophaga parva TaxID=2169414 RepID=UPI001403EABA|nr:FecR family protein [Chitinophaga parva]
MRRIRYTAAAALLVVGIAFFIITRDGRHDKVPPIPTALIAVAADHSAQLQLGDGSSVVLDSQAVESPALLSRGITYHPDSTRLVYKADQPKRGLGGSQTLSTGRGDQVNVVLPDGTRVWLNAKSALRYPATFLPGARVVELSGEGYFDVRPNRGRPFQVRTAKVLVTVLGTTFNLKAYAGEEMITTGVYQGRVQVSDSARQTSLSAGQQLVITSDGNWHAAAGAELAAAAAWKDKLFVFRRTPLPDIIAELSRWYTVEFQIAPGLSRTFSGTIPRTATITTVLEVLKESGISFRKDRNKIVFFD